MYDTARPSPALPLGLPAGIASSPRPCWLTGTLWWKRVKTQLNRTKRTDMVIGLKLLLGFYSTLAAATQQYHRATPWSQRGAAGLRLEALLSATRGSRCSCPPGGRIRPHHKEPCAFRLRATHEPPQQGQIKPLLLLPRASQLAPQTPSPHTITNTDGATGALQVAHSGLLLRGHSSSAQSTGGCEPAEGSGGTPPQPSSTW